MGTLSNPPVKYDIYNSISTKKLAIVVDIEGLDYLTSTTIGRVLQYGDPFVYGDPITYGGIVPIGTNPGERGQKILLDLNGSSMTISQRLEPEQGRASISTLAMTFIDKDKYMTRACTPGKIIDEILGKEVKIWLGYAQTSFPEDFYVVWRGRVAQINPEIGRISLQFTDPNLGKRQQVFYSGQTKLGGNITALDTTIPVVSNTDFHRKILGPDSTYDQTVKTYIKIEDEFIEYQQSGSEGTGFGVNQFLNVQRGARATTPAIHAVDADVDSYLEIAGHAVALALKIQMSGWNGPYLADYAIQALGQTGDPIVPFVANAIVLGQNVDGLRDLGLTVGDFITITGDPTPSNNGTCIVQGFANSSGQTNKLVLVDKVFLASPLTPALIAMRSQFDTYPTTCGAKLPGWEVDVAGHIYYQNTYLFDTANSYRFLLNAPESAKTFIESQIMLPLGAYCLTRQGKLSMGLTKPPIADERTTRIDHSNVLEPQTIKLQRGLNNRKYFNEIDWDYDYNDAGNAVNLRRTLDTDSLNLIGVSSVLPIKAKGARSDLGFEIVVLRREQFLFGRYAMAAVLIDLKVNFGAGNLVEAGDVVLLTDNGQLQIPNLSTGERDMGEQLLEVINRSIDLKTGQVSLQLIGGLGAQADDRFATIAPSSHVTTGTTVSKIRIKESFGAVFPLQEQKKWEDYSGMTIAVHSYDWTTRYGETVILGIDPTDDHALLVAPPLSFVPLVDDIVDLVAYPDNTDPLDQRTVKLIHSYLDPTVAIVSGVDNFSFNVALIDAPKFIVEHLVMIHNSTYSIMSPEVRILSVVGTLVTVDADLGFTPAAGQSAELLGFKDGGQPYRFV